MSGAETKTSRPKKSVAAWLITIVAWGVGFWLAREAVVYLMAESGYREVNLKANADLPKRLNERVTLERIDITKASTTYFYKTNMSQAQMDADTQSAPAIRASVCADATLGKQIRQGTKYIYRYATASGQDGSTVTIDRCP